MESKKRGGKRQTVKILYWTNKEIMESSNFCWNENGFCLLRGMSILIARNQTKIALERRKMHSAAVTSTHLNKSKISLFGLSWSIPWFYFWWKYPSRLSFCKSLFNPKIVIYLSENAKANPKNRWYSNSCHFNSWLHFLIQQNLNGIDENFKIKKIRLSSQVIITKDLDA